MKPTPRLSNARSSSLFRQALHASSMPAIAVGFTFFAYGTQTASSGFSAIEHLLSSAVIYAIPGMLVMVDQVSLNGSVLAVALGVFLVNMRLMPMTMAISPLVRSQNRWKNIVGLHFVAMTTWLFYFRFHSQIKPEQRTDFFLMLGAFIWLVSNTLGVVGYFAAGFIPTTLLAAFIFANPLYFMCLLLDQYGKKRRSIAIFAAAFALPIFHQVFADWAVLVCGVFIGTVVYALPLKARSQ